MLHDRICNICGCVRFEDYRGREFACCSNCKSLERHRFLWFYLNTYSDLFDGYKCVLHVAPDECFMGILRDRVGSYTTADLNDDRFEQMDITDIQYDDGHFDAIICSHVLEHVPDDRKAMREFRRVLCGWAILMVPVVADKTYEDPSLSPAMRAQMFGQEDHVRNYGPDFADRLREEGFDVTVISPSDLRGEITHYAITRAAGDIYFAIPEASHEPAC